MKKRIILISAAVALSFLAGFAWWQLKPKGPSYNQAVIERGDLAVTILSTGTVQPENRLEIKPPVAGRIENVLVREGEKVTKGQILAWMSSNERAALIDAARAKGADEVKRWEELYKPTPIIAPITGTIILRNVESGQTFATTDAVLVMSDRLTVKAQIDETDLAQIKLKQKSEIRLDAYPDQTIAAKVDQIAFEARTVSNVTTYVVDVLPDTTPSYMRSGMTANVTFSVDGKKDVVLVPNEFIKYDNGKPFVLVPSEKETAKNRELKIGATDGKMSEVLDGLKEGETILQLINKKEKTGGSAFGGPPSGTRKSRGGGGPPP